MERVLESDVAFYYAVGGFVIAIFLSGVVAVRIVSPESIDLRTLLPLSAGFFLFMFVYFISISIQRIEAGEDI